MVRIYRPLEATTHLSLKTKERLESISTEALNELIVDCIQDIKGKGIVKLDLRSLDDAPTDYFIICEGESFVQTKSIANHIQLRVKRETGILPSHLEGTSNAKWVLVDYFHTVVHVFYPETREFYQLEELWNDAALTTYEDIA